MTQNERKEKGGFVPANKKKQMGKIEKGIQCWNDKGGIKAGGWETDKKWKSNEGIRMSREYEWKMEDRNRWRWEEDILRRKELCSQKWKLI